MKTFDTEQLTRFKQYTEADLAATKDELQKAPDDGAFDAAFSKRNALNEQAALIQQHIDAPKPTKKVAAPGDVVLTPEQKKAAKEAAKAAAKAPKVDPPANQ